MKHEYNFSCGNSVEYNITIKDKDVELLLYVLKGSKITNTETGSDAYISSAKIGKYIYNHIQKGFQRLYNEYLVKNPGGTKEGFDEYIQNEKLNIMKSFVEQDPIVTRKK